MREAVNKAICFIHTAPLRNLTARTTIFTSTCTESNPLCLNKELTTKTTLNTNLNTHNGQWWVSVWRQGSKKNLIRYESQICPNYYQFCHALN